MIRRVLDRKPEDTPPAAGVSKLDPLRDLQRLADHITPAIDGDDRQTRRAVAVSLRVGLAHAPRADIGLVAAVVVERVAELDPDALAAVHKAAHDESHRRAAEPLTLAEVTG